MNPVSTASTSTSPQGSPQKPQQQPSQQDARIQTAALATLPETFTKEQKDLALELQSRISKHTGSNTLECPTTIIETAKRNEVLELFKAQKMLFDWGYNQTKVNTLGPVSMKPMSWICSQKAKAAQALAAQPPVPAPRVTAPTRQLPPLPECPAHFTALERGYLRDVMTHMARKEEGYIFECNPPDTLSAMGRYRVLNFLVRKNIISAWSPHAWANIPLIKAKPSDVVHPVDLEAPRRRNDPTAFYIIPTIWIDRNTLATQPQDAITFEMLADDLLIREFPDAEDREAFLKDVFHLNGFDPKRNKRQLFDSGNSETHLAFLKKLGLIVEYESSKTETRSIVWDVKVFSL